MSPLFIQYIKISTGKQVILFISLIAVSTFIHRPFMNLSPIHSVLYFLPIYLLGIIYSMNDQKILNFIKNKRLALSLATISISIAQVIQNKCIGNYHKAEIFSCEGIDFIIIQKVLMIFLFLSVLKKIDKKEFRSLKYFASISFAIYFLHPWMLKLLEYLNFIQYVSFIPGPIAFAIKTILVTALSIATATLFKKIFSKTSRYIIGY